MSINEQIILVSAGVLATMITRFTPFIVFRPEKPTPKYISYLGKVLPAAVFAMLVVYCLRNIFIVQHTATGFQGTVSPDATAQILGVMLTIIVHLWRKNMMLSIACGTIGYMLLIRLI